LPPGGVGQVVVGFAQEGLAEDSASGEESRRFRPVRLTTPSQRTPATTDQSPWLSPDADNRNAEAEQVTLD
jgi:hypothetical protein